MNSTKANHFDQSAANWDAEPRRVELANAVGEAILRQVQPTRGMDVLDYGCGTGLLGLFLLPHVRSVTGADSSPGMLESPGGQDTSRRFAAHAGGKARSGARSRARSRYHLIAANMVLHHVDQIEVLLTAFHQMLLPGGVVAIADLDTEPGLFHGPESPQSVYHHGFDRRTLMDRLYQGGICRLQRT